MPWNFLGIWNDFKQLEVIDLSNNGIKVTAASSPSCFSSSSLIAEFLIKNIRQEYRVFGKFWYRYLCFESKKSFLYLGVDSNYGKKITGNTNIT
jgi:hypothetical protein